MRLVHKQIKRKRKPDQVRQRDWMAATEHWDELHLSLSERVLLPGEQERRRTIWTMALDKLEEESSLGDAASPTADTTGRRGRVIEVSTSLCRVNVRERVVLCTVRGTLGAADSGFTNVVAVGDEVVVSLDGTGRGVVETVLPRRTVLVRPDVFYGHLQQVIVANADQLLVVASWRNPAIWLELVDRYLIAAERSHLIPVICVNKVDLAEDRAACQATLQPYLDLGYRVLFTSALTGEGVAELQEVLRGRLTVLAGLSGVGKSSLLAAVQPGLQLRTSHVSAHGGQGRHTTVQVAMLELEMGGFVADTPGIREFGLSGLRSSELARFYREIAAVPGCRFPDCSHTHEPGCAVQAAVRERRVSAYRYHNYKNILESLPK